MTTSFSPIACTPLQAWHLTHGARLIEHNGWRIPSVFSNVSAETAAARDGLALADLSALGKISLRGQEVPPLARSLFGDHALRRVIRLKDHLGWACCLTPFHCLLLSADVHQVEIAINRILDAAGIQNLPGYSDEIVFEATSAYAAFGLFGPKGGVLLSELTSLDLESVLPAGACAETGLAGVHAILIRPETSVGGIYLLVAWDLAQYVWERLWHAGEQAHMIPLGMEAVRALYTLAS
jgi:glycine cleavage system aminomethyltransferase T